MKISEHIGADVPFFINGGVARVGGKGEIINIASGKPIKLTKFIEIIEKKLKLKANKNFLKLQQGDVVKTYGSIGKINKELGYNPKTSLNQGVSKFIKWYIKFYKVGNKKNRI